MKLRKWLAGLLTLLFVLQPLSGIAVLANETEQDEGEGAQTYLITYYLNEEAGSQCVVDEQIEGAVTLRTALNSGLFNEGSQLTGWVDGVGKAYTPGQVITLESDLVLYGVWTEIQKPQSLKANQSETFLLTIRYLRYEEDIALSVGILDYTGEYYEGEQYSVSSPSLNGYIASPAVVSGTMDGADKVLEVIYTAETDVSYTVEHRYETLDGGYDVVTEYKTGVTDTYTQAEAASKEGFEAGAFRQSIISGDGHTKVVIAYYRVENYVYFNTGSGAFIAPVLLKYGEIFAPADFVAERVNHDFLGWYTNEALTQQAPAEMEMGTEDITLYAKWQAVGQAQYTVVYLVESLTVPGGYDVYETQQYAASVGSVISYDASAFVPGFSAQDQLGFEFERSDDSIAVKEDGTSILNVYYLRKTFTIQFYRFRTDFYESVVWDNRKESNYNYLNSGQYDIVAKYGENILSYWTPAKIAECRWHLSVNDDELYYKSMLCMPAFETLVIKLWGRVEPKGIGFNVDDAYLYHYIEAMPGDVVNYTDPATGVQFTQFGERIYSTKRWTGDTMPSATIEDAYNISGFRAVTADDIEPYEKKGSGLNVYYTARIKYYREEYTIQFNANGGMLEDDVSVVVKYGYEFEIPAQPTRAGYQFKGWFLNTTASGEPVIGPAQTGNMAAPAFPTKTVTLYAGWEKVIYPVAFDLNYEGATGGPPSQSVAYLDRVSEPVEPVREGYLFKGWYSNPSCVGAKYVFSQPVYYALTLYAKWEADPDKVVSYTVEHLKDNNEALYAMQTLEGVNGEEIVATAYSHPDYVPDAFRKTLVLSWNGENKIVFYYTHKEELNIAYVEYHGYISNGEFIVFDDIDPEFGETNASRIRVQAKTDILGYKAVTAEQAVQLVNSQDPYDNEIFHEYKRVVTDEIVVEDYNEQYDGEEHGVILPETLPEGFRVQYSDASDGPWQNGPLTEKDVTSIPSVVYVRIMHDDYHEFITSATITITRRQLKVIPDEERWEKGSDEADPAFTFTFGNTLDGETPYTLGALTREDAANNEPGTYDIVADFLYLVEGQGFDADNYTLVYDANSVLVIKKSSADLPEVFEVNADSLNVIYDGKAHGLIIDTLDEDTVVEYQDANGNYSTDSPTITDVGSVVVAYRVQHPDYIGAVENTATVTVRQRTLTVVPSLEEWVKVITAPNAAGADPEFTYTINNVVEGESLTTNGGKLSRAYPLDNDVATSYALTLGNLELRNSNDGTFKAANYTLSLSPGVMIVRYDNAVLANSVAATGVSQEYDGKVHGIHITAPFGSTITYKISETEDYGSSEPKQKDVNSAPMTVYYQVTHPHYIGEVTGEATIKIDPKPIVAVPALRNFTKTPQEEEDPDFDFTLESGITGETPGFTGALSREDQENHTVGVYAITLGSLELDTNGTFNSDNYTLSVKEGHTLMIKNSELALKDIVQSAGVTKSYDGTASGISVKVTNAPEKATVTYSLEENGEYQAFEAFAQGLLTQKDVGEKTVHYQVEHKDYFGVLKGSETIKISPRTIIITPRQQTYYKTPDEDDPRFDYTPSAAAENEVLVFNGALSRDRADSNAIGSYNIILGTLGLDDRGGGFNKANYTLAIASGYSLVIKNAQTVLEDLVEVDADNLDKVYDGAELKLQFVSLPADAVVKYKTTESGEYSDEIPPITNVGSLTVYYEVTHKDYFGAAEGSATLTVRKATITVTPEKALYEKAVGEADPVFNYTLSDAVIGEEAKVTGALSRVNPTVDAVGEYALTLGDLEPADNGKFKADNYELVLGGSSKLIVKNAQTVLESLVEADADSLNKVYDGMIHQLTVDAPSGATITYKTESAGNYDVEAPGLKDVGSLTVYYEVTHKDYFGAAEGSATLTVRKARIVATPTQGVYEKTVEEADPVFNYTLSGEAADEKAVSAGALSRVNPTVNAVGEYALTLGDLNLTSNGIFKADNYELVLNSSSKLVIKDTQPTDPTDPDDDPTDPVVPPNPAQPTEPPQSTPVEPVAPAGPEVAMVEDTVEGDEIPVVNNVIDNTRNEAEPEPSQQTLTIGNTEIPLFGGSDFGNWSLFNVIMSIIMTIVPLLILLKRRKKDEPERWNKLVLFVSTVFGLIVLCIVLIASKFSATMVLFNKWSWLVAAAAVVVAGLMIFAKRSSEAKSGEEQYV